MVPFAGLAVDGVAVAMDSVVFATYVLWGLFVVVQLLRMRGTYPGVMRPLWFLGALLFPFIATLFLIWLRLQERRQESS